MLAPHADYTQLCFLQFDLPRLLQEREANPNCSRTAFFLAVIAHNVLDLDLAFKSYGDRLTMGGNPEELYESHLRRVGPFSCVCCSVADTWPVLCMVSEEGLWGGGSSSRWGQTCSKFGTMTSGDQTACKSAGLASPVEQENRKSLLTPCHVMQGKLQWWWGQDPRAELVAASRVLPYRYGTFDFNRHKTPAVTSTLSGSVGFILV